MRLPSIKDVRADLKLIWQDLRVCFTPKQAGEFLREIDDYPDDPPGTNVRLQVTQNGSWDIYTGDQQFDQAHQGYWGIGWLTYKRQNLTELAKDLITQVADDRAVQEDWT